MNKSLTLAALLLAGFCASPVLAAGPLTDTAVALAAPNSGASIDTLCQATYRAVKESPDEADTIFSKILAQRTTWTSEEVYAIFRAILLALPDVERSFSNYVAAAPKRDAVPRNNKDGKGESISGSSYGAAGEKDPQDLQLSDDIHLQTLFKLMAVVYEASLADGVAQTVVNMVTLQYAHTDLGMLNYAIIAGNISTYGQNTNMLPQGRSEGDVVPTPPATSPRN